MYERRRIKEEEEEEEGTAVDGRTNSLEKKEEKESGKKKLHGNLDSTKKPQMMFEIKRRESGIDLQGRLVLSFFFFHYVLTGCPNKN